MSAQQTTNAEAEASKAGMSLDEKIGMAKKFDREMKDYAKATVKEFLGIYGYEEDVDINIDESETQKANETIEPDEKCTETDSSTTAVLFFDENGATDVLIQDHSSMIDCHSLGCKSHLGTPGTCEARVVVMIETDDGSEVSEISNVQTTSRPENRSSNFDLPFNEKLPCSTEILATEIETSECEKIGNEQKLQGEICENVLRFERESHSEMCGSQWTSCETLGETLVSQDRLGTLRDSVDCGTREQSTETVEVVDHFDKVLISQNTDRIENETLEQHAKSVSSFEGLETTDSKEELDRTAGTLVDNTLEVSQALSIPTPSEIFDAISQIIPHSEPVVLKEHSYSSQESNSSRILQDAPSSDIQEPRLPDNEPISSLENIPSQNVQFCTSPVLVDSSNDFCDCSNKKALDNSKSTLDLHSTTPLSDTLQPQSSSDSSLEAGQYKTQIILLEDSPGSKEKKRLSTQKKRKNETAEKREKRLNVQRERTRKRRLQESETEREARREKDRKRQQLKRTRNKEMGIGDILSRNKQLSENILHSASQIVSRVEDRGSPSTISQFGNSLVSTASSEEGELNCRSVRKSVVILISEDTNIVPVSEDANVVPILEDTNTVPCQRPKVMQDPVFTNPLVSSQSGNFIDGQQLFQSGKGYHREEIYDMKEGASGLTSDILSTYDSSVLQRDDRDVTQDNSNNLAVPENGEDLDIHKEIDVLNNQILSGLTESAQTMPELSASQEDKDIPNHVDSSVIETSLVGSKLCLTEGDPALPRGVPCQGEVIGQEDSSERTLKEKNRDRIRRRRAMETPEQREMRLKQQRERVRERRANETDLQRESRRDQDRIRKQIKRTSESAESRSKRLLQHRDAMRRKRALESPEEKQLRQLKDKDRAKRSRESKRAGVVIEWWKK